MKKIKLFLAVVALITSAIMFFPSKVEASGGSCQWDSDLGCVAGSSHWSCTGCSASQPQ